MENAQAENTLVLLKPDSFWRHLNEEVAARIKNLGLKVVAECTLANGDNLAEEQWREFYFPAIGDRPAILKGTSGYMAFGPVQAFRLEGEGAIQKVRKAIGVTRPWEAAQGTIRGDYWPGAEAANAPYLGKFKPPGADTFLFNLVHASDSAPSFAREILFFKKLG